MPKVEKRLVERRRSDRSPPSRHAPRIEGSERNDSVPRSGSPPQHTGRSSAHSLPRGSSDNLGVPPPQDPKYAFSNETRSGRHALAPSDPTAHSRDIQRHLSGGQPYSTSTDPYGPQPSSTTAQPSVQTNLSALGRRFADIGLADYEECETFIHNHRDILQEPHRHFLDSAVEAIRNSRFGDAQRCIQQVLILRRCEEIGRGRFFDRIIGREEDTMTAFIADFRRVYEGLRERAGAPQPSAPQIDRSTLPRSSSLEGSQQRRHIETATSGITEGVARTSLSNIPQANRHENQSGLPGIPEKPEFVSMSSNRPGEGLVSRARTDSSNTELPRRNSVRGSIGNNPQVLDRRYTLRNSNFFVVGRVFAVIWYESSGAGDTAASDWSRYDNQAPYGQQVYSTPRRMVVVKRLHGSCWCLPVTTYNGRGLRKRGLDQKDIDAHAIIYMAGTDPMYLEGEKRSKKRPIAVKPAHDDQKLDVASRVNFSKVHTVEHNQKVMNVGMVTEQSMPYLIGFFKEQIEDS